MFIMQQSKATWPKILFKAYKVPKLSSLISGPQISKISWKIVFIHSKIQLFGMDSILKTINFTHFQVEKY